MIQINKEMFDTKVPYMNREYFESLDNTNQENYLRLYEVYNNLLIQYLIKYYNLKEFDDVLSKDKRNFEKVNTNDMDIYQYLSSEYLNYIYLRNNIYIERLSDEELLYLSKITDHSLNKENEEFIKNTYLKVITESNNNNATTMFGPDNLKFIKRSNWIVFGIRYNRFNLKDKSKEDEWIIQDDEREKFISMLLPMIEMRLKEKQPNTCIIGYNEFCIEKIKKIF
mgnify:CR=1 FL=1